jgi:hypothetical protein
VRQFVFDELSIFILHNISSKFFMLCYDGTTVPDTNVVILQVFVTFYTLIVMLILKLSYILCISILSLYKHDLISLINK